MAGKLIVFDCDGTLVDSQASIVASMQAAFDICHLPRPTASAIRRIVGLPLAAGVAHLAGGVLSASAAERVAEAYRHAFRALRQNDQIDDPLYNGISATIDRLEADGWLLGVATGKGHRGLQTTLEVHGLSNRFVTLQTADNNPGKPDPGMLLSAMADAGTAPAETIMVGDTTFDMEMSVNAGTLAIGVAWGYHEADELLAAGAAVVLDAPEDLLPCLTEFAPI